MFKKVSLLLMCLLAFNSFAQEDEGATTPQKVGLKSYEESKKNESEIESWYAYWGLGGGSVRYNDDAQKRADALKSAQGVDHVTFSLDLLGFYYPFHEQKLITGVILNYINEMYVDDSDASLEVQQYTYSLSTMKFFGRNVGDGFFLRADAGITKFRESLEGIGTKLSASSKTGFGYLGGFGYAMPVSNEARILFSANYSHRKVKADKTSNIIFSIGMLF